MSNIEELLTTKGQNGIVKYRIDELCTISRGRVMSKDYISENIGEYPVYSSQTENEGELGRISTYDFEGEYLTWTTDGANAGTVFYRTGRFSVTNVCGLLKTKSNLIITRYLYYVLSIEAPSHVNKGMGNPKLMSNVMARIQILVPPIEVQREIVRILDNFNELTKTLTAELSARKKQYEYYRNQLFSLQGDIHFVTLEDISENCDSQRKPVTKGKRNAGQYPYYGASGIVDYVEDYIFEGEYLLISEDGANLLARVTPIAFSITGKNWVNNHAHVLKFADKYEQRYVEMYLNGMDLSKYISGASQPKLNQKNLNSIPIPMPSKAIVKRIVDVLDYFERLCNDLSSGLPAEIEARQKQYEYYRDKLLTFKEKV